MSAGVDDLLRDLHRELAAAEPGPNFRQRARAYALLPRRRRLVVASMALALAAVLVMLVGGGGVEPRGANPIVAPSAVLTTAARTPAADPPTSPRSMNGAKRDRVSPWATPVRPSEPVSAPEVLVPPDQAIALDNWLQTLRARRSASAVLTTAATAVPAIAPLVMNPIHIEPVAVTPRLEREKN